MARDETFLLIHSLVHGKPIPMITNRPGSSGSGSGPSTPSSTNTAPSGSHAPAATASSRRGSGTTSSLSTTTSSKDDGSYWGQPSQLEPSPLAPTPLHSHGHTHGHAHGHHGHSQSTPPVVTTLTNRDNLTSNKDSLSGDTHHPPHPHRITRDGRSLSVDAQLERPDRKSLERDSLITGEPLDTPTHSSPNAGIELLPIPDKRPTSTSSPAPGAGARATTPAGTTSGAAGTVSSSDKKATPSAGAGTSFAPGNGSTSPPPSIETKSILDDGPPLYPPRDLKKSLNYGQFRPPVPTPAEAAKQELDKVSFHSLFDVFCVC
jgi:hypothetical protein